MSNRLFVGNLPYSATEAELRPLFEAFGAVVDIHIVKDRETGRPRGFAFISLKTEDQARQAAEQLNGKPVDGRPLVVNVARERGAPAPRRDGPRPQSAHRPAAPAREPRPRPAPAAPPAGWDAEPAGEERPRPRKRKPIKQREKGPSRPRHFNDDDAPKGTDWRRWLEDEDD